MSSKPVDQNTCHTHGALNHCLVNPFCSYQSRVHKVFNVFFHILVPPLGITRALYYVASKFYNVARSAFKKSPDTTTNIKNQVLTHLAARPVAYVTTQKNEPVVHTESNESATVETDQAMQESRQKLIKGMSANKSHPWNHIFTGGIPTHNCYGKRIKTNNRIDALADTDFLRLARKMVQEPVNKETRPTECKRPEEDDDTQTSVVTKPTPDVVTNPKIEELVSVMAPEETQIQTPSILKDRGVLNFGQFVQSILVSVIAERVSAQPLNSKNVCLGHQIL